MTKTTWTDHTGLIRDGNLLDQADIRHPAFGRVIAYLVHETRPTFEGTPDTDVYRVELYLLDKGQANQRTVKTEAEARKAMDQLRAAAK